MQIFTLCSKNAEFFSFIPLRLTFPQDSRKIKNLFSWLMCVQRGSLSIFNYQALAWPKLQSENKIRNALVEQRRKIENYQCIRAEFEQQTEGGCVSFFNHKLFFPGQCFKKLISILTLRIIIVLISGGLLILLPSHRRWLLFWVCALKLIVRETKKKLIKKNCSWIVPLPCFFFQFSL